MTLEAGDTNEMKTVEIKGVAPMTQTDNGEVSVAQESRVVHEIPVIDAKHWELAEFETGIAPPDAAFPFEIDPDRTAFTPLTGNWHQNYLDGVENQEPYRNTAVRVIPEDMIEQVNISTANLSMDKGFMDGAYNTGNSRDGTNTLRGDLFEFYSGNPLRTRSYFDTLDNSSPRFVNNQSGAAAAGLIVKDKIFFFGS